MFFQLFVGARCVMFLEMNGGGAGTGGRKPDRSEASGRGAAARAATGASGALLSKLFDGIEGEPVQVELSEVRVLPELLGFLLRARSLRPRVHLTCRVISVYNVQG